MLSAPDSRQEKMSRKRALDELLRVEGTTLAEWVQEQLDLLAGDPPQLPSYPEAESAADLQNPTAALRALRRMDWAFSADDTLYLSHDVHPYPAKFIPQIPGSLIARLSLRGELVMDPFGGSGTTALEAARLGRRALSVDANPLGSLIGRVKTARLDSAGSAELRALAAVIRGRLQGRPSAAESWLQEFSAHVPAIHNIEKWFADWPRAELALIRACIQRLIDPVARDVASLALSRTVLKVSNQESETRYVSVARDIPGGFALARFLHELGLVIERVTRTAEEVQYGVVEFVTADSRNLRSWEFPADSIDLIVTSPPYGNANDYHLYHRFRLYWLGHDPQALAGIEIGSHLRHQREGTGFREYMADVAESMRSMFRLLKPGRYAAIVVGDAIYEGERFNGAHEFSRVAKKLGYEHVGSINRPVHGTKRSFQAGRRAEQESIVILRKPVAPVALVLRPPKYRMWPYEVDLRRREAVALLGDARGNAQADLRVECDPYTATRARRLAFSRGLSFGVHNEMTWQEALENGLRTEGSSRKDPKYVTHGVHAYKGKFYPQLAKALINLSGCAEGASVLDPFCGSGTTLLESRLNGLAAFGLDLHPLAAKIARAKVEIIDVPPSIVRDVATAIDSRIESAPSNLDDGRDQFKSRAVDEIEHWFADPVVTKINWLLANIRALSYGVLQDLLEILLSDLLREVSHQEPADLRIRRRKTPLQDADVLGLFRGRLTTQLTRLESFWRVRGYSPYRFWPSAIANGDARETSAFKELDLQESSVDLVLTSPPYATALPYIDTDRLSLLVLFGTIGADRRPLEQALTGSREISLGQRRELEKELDVDASAFLPDKVLRFVRKLRRDNSADGVGFRRQNLAALLYRFFGDMDAVLRNIYRVTKPGAELVMVLGNNYTKVEGVARTIPTSAFLLDMAQESGFEKVESIPITVTKENVLHSKQAITHNTVLRLRRA
jgi:DNA modification methylase